MTGEKQNQRVGEASLAVQATGDATVNLGISTEQMRAIVETMADQLPKYAAIAAAVVDERLKSFEDKIVGKFEDELKDHRKAFEDPDFQYLLISAQQTYARSGSDDTCDNLVNLIGERSKHTDRSLLSLSLNTAVERAGVLSKQEFACLSYSFMLRKVRHRVLQTPGDLAVFLLQHLEPLFADMPRSGTSYSYLESIGCGKIVPFTRISFRDVFTRTYPHIFGGHITLDQIAAQNGGDATFGETLRAAGFLVPQSNGGFTLTNIAQDEFTEAVKNAGLDESKANTVFSVIEQNAPQEDEIARSLEAHGFAASKHFELMRSTPLGSFDPTTVGMAIGHANLRRLVNFPADLSIWLPA